MNQRAPGPLDDRAARRNYIVFAAISAIVLFVIVLFGSLMVSV
jgi:hypothetical protein